MGKTSYVKDWDKFFDVAVDLLIANPFKVIILLLIKIEKREF